MVQISSPETHRTITLQVAFTPRDLEIISEGLYPLAGCPVTLTDEQLITWVQQVVEEEINYL